MQGTQDKDKQNKTKTQRNMCWTPLYANNNFIKSNHLKKDKLRRLILVI